VAAPPAKGTDLIALRSSCLTAEVDVGSVCRHEDRSDNPGVAVATGPEARFL